MISIIIVLTGVAGIAYSIMKDIPTEGEQLLTALQALSLYELDEIKLVGSKVHISKFIQNTNSWMHAQFDGDSLLAAILKALEYIRDNGVAWIEQEYYVVEEIIKEL